MTNLPRQISVEEQKKLDNDKNLISKFNRDKLEKEAKKNWDLFYKRNKDHFFKDRHWTQREFKELLLGLTSSSDNQSLLEVGCGVGNLIFPLIESKFAGYIYACDFSPIAVDLLKQHQLYDENVCKAFVADITDSNFISFCSSICHPVNIITMIFVLSSIEPAKMSLAIKNMYQILHPGGIVLFRDYGLHDYAMLRFSEGHKIDDSFYVRQDGTRVFYFTTEYLRDLFCSYGFQEQKNGYIHKETVNKKESISVPRVFVQAKFVKPLTS